MNLIEVSNVDKAFNDKKILNNVSFTVKEGSINGLLGPNGAGKTTMIRLLNGVIHPTGGEINVMGYDPQKNGDEIRRRAGIITESAALYHDMTAWENLSFFARIYGAYDVKRIDYLLQQFNMVQHKDELVGTFSTGMKKRISLAKALLHKPRLLFLDEPTNGLDPEGIKEVIQYLGQINQEEKVTILICSHVLHQLETICDSFLFLSKGRLIEKGTRLELEDKYLSQVYVVIETGLQLEGNTFMEFAFRRIGPNRLKFCLPSKNEIPVLLTRILQVSWVHSCEITNRSLESLYFKIKGDSDEQTHH